MILTDINGGLGNQMFQYAAARSLSLFHNTDLKINTGIDSENKLPEGLIVRPFGLNYFNLNLIQASEKEINSFSKPSFLNRLIRKLKPNYEREIYHEPFFHFDPAFYKASGHVYLKGLRQSEKYFLRYSEYIRNDFRFPENESIMSHPIVNEIKSSSSVSVHIRRGDYLAKISQEVLGLLPLDYYAVATETVHLKVSDPHYYIFSDDINWVKENINIPNASYVSGAISKTHFEDLYLMSQCKHNIIANSSFSWWGAWLNNNPEKIVIAPKNWFNKGPKDTYDLYPDGWIKI